MQHRNLYIYEYILSRNEENNHAKKQATGN